MAESFTQGQISFEYRRFEDDMTSETHDEQISVFSRIDTKYQQAKNKFVLRAYARVHSGKSGQDIVVAEDLYYSTEVKDFIELGAGYKIYNWSNLEVFRPADTVNSKNLDTDIEKFEKIGELSLYANMFMPNGQLSIYFFPKSADPLFPTKESRFGLNIPVEDPIWVDKDGHTSNWNNSGAIRFTQSLGAVDFQAHILNHYDRDYFILGLNDELAVVPYFFRVNESSVGLQHSADQYLTKFEVTHKNYQDESEVLSIVGTAVKPKDFSVAALGLEYDQSFDHGSTGKILIEYQRILGVSLYERSILSVFQNDLFVNYSYNLNDTMGTQLSLGSFIDLERSHEFLHIATYTRRLSNTWKYNINMRLFDAPIKSSPDGMEILNQSDSLSFSLDRFF